MYISDSWRVQLHVLMVKAHLDANTGVPFNSKIAQHNKGVFSYYTESYNLVLKYLWHFMVNNI